MRKSLSIVGALFVAFAVTGFLFRDLFSDPMVVGMTVTLIALISLPFAAPPVARFISAHRRVVFWTGIAMTVGGVGAIFAFARVLPPPGGRVFKVVSLALAVIPMAGIGIALMPRSVAASERARARLAERKPQPLRPAAFSGVKEAWTATATTVGALFPFLRLVGPWVALLWALPYVGVHFALLRSGMIPTFFATPTGAIDPGVEIADGGLPFLFTALIGVPTALVAWHRYVIAARKPRSPLPLPDLATLRYLFRLWMLFILLSLPLRLAASNASDVARLLGISNRAGVALAIYAIGLAAILWLGSSYALVFPAVAEGNRDFLSMDAVRAAKPLGNAFRLGVFLSLLPIGAVAVASAVLNENAGLVGWRLSPAQYAFRLIPIAGVFFALANCATYLSLVYRMQVSEEANSLGSLRLREQ